MEYGQEVNNLHQHLINYLESPTIGFHPQAINRDYPIPHLLQLILALDKILLTVVFPSLDGTSVNSWIASDCHIGALPSVRVNPVANDPGSRVSAFEAK